MVSNIEISVPRSRGFWKVKRLENLDEKRVKELGVLVYKKDELRSYSEWTRESTSGFQEPPSPSCKFKRCLNHKERANGH